MAGFDILIREQGGEWVHPASRKYKNERDMQELLAANPNWIPGVEGKAIVALEISTMAGPADICVLTDDGGRSRGTLANHLTVRWNNLLRHRRRAGTS